MSAEDDWFYRLVVACDDNGAMANAIWNDMRRHPQLVIEALGGERMCQGMDGVLRPDDNPPPTHRAIWVFPKGES